MLTDIGQYQRRDDETELHTIVDTTGEDKEFLYD